MGDGLILSFTLHTLSSSSSSLNGPFRHDPHSSTTSAWDVLCCKVEVHKCDIKEKDGMLGLGYLAITLWPALPFYPLR